MLFAVFALWIGGIFNFSPSGLEKEITIDPGQSVWQIGSNLKNQNLIKSPVCFWIWLLITGDFTEVKAGTYLLSSSMTIPEIAQKLVQGKTVQQRITIIEGWTRQDIASYLEQKGICSKDKFLKETKPGFLFPDTYFVQRESSCKDFIKQIGRNFNKILTPQLRKEIEKQQKTISEIITMASLLEKEVKNFEDKKLISGILWKRLEYNIPLQVDATLGFITGKQSLQFTEKEKKIDSPYNTYKYQGLPPGPICNPGLESIKAAVYPKHSEYWYYLSTSKGDTVFSKTLREHNRAKAKYLQ